MSDFLDDIIQQKMALFHEEIATASREHLDYLSDLMAQLLKEDEDG